MNRRQPPPTERVIYRIGQPIPFPTGVEELTAQLIWALDMLHIHEHEDNSYSVVEVGALTKGSPISPYCRMRLALQDPRFACPDPWHLSYHGESRGKPGGDCPTCGLHWIATKRGT